MIVKEKTCRRRRGMNLVEMVGVVAILAVLIGIGVGGVSAAQQKARIVTCEKALAAYQGAFISATGEKPALAFATYDDYSELVPLMNSVLDETLQLEAVVVGGKTFWKALGQDPWGGDYVLTVHPNHGTPAQPTISCSIWSTGLYDIGTEPTGTEIQEDFYGIGLKFSGGLVTYIWNGFNGLADDFAGKKLPKFK